MSQEKYDKAAKCINTWLTNCKSDLDQLVREPIAAEPAQIQKQIDRLKAFSNDVVRQQDGVRLVETTGNSLGEVMPSMILHINKTTTKVHTRYDKLCGKIDKRLSTLQSALSLCVQYTANLLWLAKAERSLTSAQPLNEKSPAVKQQYDTHKLLHEDIQSHQSSILQYVKDIEQFLKTWGDRGRSALDTHLRSKQGELRRRYDAVLTQSSNRQKILTQAFDDLQKLEDNFTKFQNWLQAAECKMYVTKRNVAIELQTLKEQQADLMEFGKYISDKESDLKSLKVAGQTYMDLAESYRQKLAEFRTSLPRESCGFQVEAPAAYLLTGQLRDLNDRFDEFRGYYDKLLRHFNELVAKHQTYAESASSVYTWLGKADITFDKMKSEALVRSREIILTQIERVNTFYQDVVAYASDVKNVKTNGEDLISSQPAVKVNVQRTTGDITRCYQTLEMGMNNLLDKVLVANIQGVLGKIDSLLQWLDEVEKEQHCLEKETWTPAWRETILEQVKKKKMDISARQSDIDAINNDATQLFQTIDTIDSKEAKIIREKLCEANDRYQKVSDATARHRRVLGDLFDSVNDFEICVDRLEEWELSLIQTLNARGMEQLEMPQLLKRLKDAQQQVDGQRPVLKQVMEMGEQLIKELRANDATFVKDILVNANLNWAIIEDSLALRMEQVDGLRMASQKYDSRHKDATLWLDCMEERVNQARSNIKDRTTIQGSIRELEPFLEEVDVNNPNITTLNSTGDSLNAFMWALAQPVSCRPRYRSTRREVEMVPASEVDSERHFDAGTSIKRELGDLNQRCADLRKCLVDCLDELHVADRCHEEIEYVKITLAWMEAIHAKLGQCKPDSQEVVSFRKEINVLKILQMEIKTKQPQIISSVESFKHNFRDMLTTEQLKPLEEKVDELKVLYDRVYSYSNAWVGLNAPQALDDPLREEEERVTESRPTCTVNFIHFLPSISARLQLYGAHTKKLKIWITRMTVTTAVLITALCLASERTHHHFEAGSRGTVTFDAPWTPRDGVIVFFNVRFESERHPFCTLTNRHQEGFKSLRQYDRFRISYTQTDSTVRVTVEISDVSEEDAGVYILTLTSIDADNGKAVLLEKEVGVHQPRGNAQCNIHESTDGYSIRYAEVSCRAVAGRGSPTLACYQHGVKVPYKGQVHNDGRYVYGTFWMKLDSSPIYCCSHDEGEKIYQNSCRDFVWPPQALTTGKSLVTLSRTLSVSKSKPVQDYPMETPNSGCALHVQLTLVYLLVWSSVYFVNS